MGAAPCSLVHGIEALLPIEIEKRVIMKSQIPEAKWTNDRYGKLVMLDERRLKALHNVQLYKARISRAFNKRVKVRDLQEGSLVPKK